MPLKVIDASVNNFMLNPVSALISFCNQSLSPDHSLCVFDLQNGHSKWVDLSPIPDSFRHVFSGVTGICTVGEDVIITTQGESPVLAIVSIKEAKIANYLPLEKSKDTHSLVFQDGYVYVVSTGTNEIYKIHYQDGQFGKEELFWRYPDVSYDKDEVHLNGLTIDGDCFIASCFGSKKNDGSWGKDGRVFYVNSGYTILGGLHQPHSPAIIERRLVFAESAENKVYVFNKIEHERWLVNSEIALGGYARGIAFSDSCLWVGISAERKLSRSQKIFSKANQKSIYSRYVELNIETGEKKMVADLRLYGREIYDIALLPYSLTLLQELETAKQRIGEIEVIFDASKAKISELFQQVDGLQTAHHQLQAEHHQLQAEHHQLQAEHHQLQAYLRRIHDSRIWKALKMVQKFLLSIRPK